MIGSLLMLVAIIYLVLQRRDRRLGRLTFDLPAALPRAAVGDRRRAGCSPAFALAFAIKVPMWPVHTWLPDAHTEAPTGRLGDPCGRDAQDGHLRLPALRDSAVPDRCDRGDAAVHGAGRDRHHLRRAGRDGAARSEAAGRVLLGQPPGIRDARDLRVRSAGHRGRGLPDAQSRHFDRRAVFAGRDDLPAPPYARDLASSAACGRACRFTPRSSWS